MNVMSLPHRVETIDNQKVVRLEGTLKREVAGEEFQQDHLKKISEWIKVNPGVQLVAYLVPQPDNQHDPNAVQIWLCGGLVGYLPRFFAQLWQPAVIQLRQQFQAHVACAAEIELPAPNDWVTGETIQVNLFLPWLADENANAPKRIAKPKRDAVAIGVAELVFSLRCNACKRLARLTFEELRVMARCKCACGIPIPYESSDIKAPIDELKDMATLLKIETKR